MKYIVCVHMEVWGQFSFGEFVSEYTVLECNVFGVVVDQLLQTTSQSPIFPLYDNIDVSQSLCLFAGVSTEAGESETEVTSGGTQSPGTDCITSSVAHLIG